MRNYITVFQIKEICSSCTTTENSVKEVKEALMYTSWSGGTIRTTCSVCHHINSTLVPESCSNLLYYNRKFSQWSKRSSDVYKLVRRTIRTACSVCHHINSTLVPESCSKSVRIYITMFLIKEICSSYTTIENSVCGKQKGKIKKISKGDKN